MSISKSPSDIAYLRALKKARVFQRLTDYQPSDVLDDFPVDMLLKGDVRPIIEKTFDILKDLDDVMRFEFQDDDVTTSTTLTLSTQTPDVYISAAAFKFWFIVLLICFLFISVGIFHFFCIGQKNVTRRNSLEKNGEAARETTTMEMISEEVEDEDVEMNTIPSRLVHHDF